ncbi:MAG: sigma-70 family RNA polymerase sigma factor [Eubacteriales bacterium]|nr:sigma-70 family RNA polymerase sigma factor [Eubacteriales bacterium]
MKQPVDELIQLYQDNLFATAFNVCKNADDAEDIVQDVFIQYHLIKKDFESEQHIKRWLLRVTINKAKNVVKSFWKRNKMDLENYIETLSFETPEASNLFESVMKLPDKYRIVIHLFYYEDYSTKEIANILSLSESNVKVRLSRGRMLLKEMLKEEWNYDE